MKTVTLLKSFFAIIIFLMTSILIAQDTIRIIEPLPNNSEKLNLILPKVYWFNTSKITLGNYGVAKIKEGITSTSTNRKNGVTYSETKQKITISLTDSDNNTSKLQVINTKNDEYVIKENVLLNRVLDNGVKSEEIQSMVFYPNITEGTITSNLENSKKWDFILKTTDQNAILNVKIGKLTDGERAINVIRTNLDNNIKINENGEISERTLFYEFLENGISIGAVTYDDENSIWLKTGLDPITKLILCTAMLSIAY